MQLGDFPPWFLPTTVALLGLSFGSFLNVVIYRLPRGMSLSHPPSTCPGCGTPIRPYDNIPVLGWVFLRGKARCCKSPVSARYPLIEALGGVLAWALFQVEFVGQPNLGLGLFALLYFSKLALAFSLIALSFIDLEFMLLPESLTYPFAVLGVIVSYFRSDLSLVESLSGAALGFVIIWFPFIFLHEKIRGYPGMGLGDAALLLVGGAWFGWFGVIFALFIGSIQGTLAALITLLVKGRIEEPAAITEERNSLKEAIEAATGSEREELEKVLREDPALFEQEDGKTLHRIPFGPFLALSLLELLLFEDTIRTFMTVWFWERGL